MKTGKKIILIIISVCLVVLIIIGFNFIRSFLLNAGIIHFSERQVISLFEKNKDDLQIAADYALSQCIFYDQSTDTMGSDKKFKKGELIEKKNIYYCYEGYYGCKIYNKITGNKNSHFLKTVEPYYLSSEAELSFDKICKKNFSGEIVDETRNNSVYVSFLVDGGGIFDHQCIVYFKDKEHDLDFFFAYKVVPLSEDGWYYISLGDAKEW